MSKCIVSIISWMISSLLFAQPQPKFSNYTRYSVEEGLPQRYVSTVLQDSAGFIWVATLDGLTRFDGNEFLNLSQAADTLRFSSSQIYDIYLDEDEYLWVFHFNHEIDRLNTRSFDLLTNVDPWKSIPRAQFKLNSDWPESTRISSDGHGNWYAGDNQNFYLYDSTSKFQVFFDSKKNTVREFVKNYGTDQKGRLWLLREDRLEVSDKDWQNFRSIELPEPIKQPLARRPSTAFTITPEDKIIYSSDEEIVVYSIADQSFKKISVNPYVNISTNEHIRHFAYDKAQNVVFALDGYIFRLNDDGTLTLLWIYPNREEFNINMVMVDNTNTLWVATNTDGLYSVDMNVPSFHSTRYKRNFLVDLLSNDLNIHEKEIPENWKKKGWSYGLRYHHMPDRLLLTHESYGYGNARIIYQLKGKQLEKLPLEDYHFRYIVGIDESGGSLWALDIDGFLFKWKDLNQEPESFRIKEINNTAEERLSDMVGDDHSLWVINIENTIYQVQDGKIINQYHPAKDNNSSLIDIQKDVHDEDIFWIGTLGGGLIKWNKKTTSTIKIFTTKDGMPNNSIGAITPDSLGNLWLATFNGLSKFNTKKETFINYFQTDGLIENEFNRHHSLVLPDGRIALGGTDGYSVFDPGNYQSNSSDPIVHLTKLEVNGAPFTNQGRLIDLEGIRLNHDENALAFNMAAIEFNNPEKNQYRYKLQGHTDDWVELGNNTEFRFDKLPPGNYTLELNASNTDGIWSDKVRRLTIAIAPPPWLSWWAYSIYFLGGITLVFSYWRAYRKRIYRQQQIEFNKQEAKRLKEVDEIKTRFFSNITHEFRTPLTLIISPIEKFLREHTGSEEIRKLLENSHRHSTHLLKLVNQLLDISKLESGDITTHRSVGEPARFIEAVVHQFKEYSEEKGIHMKLKNDSFKGYFFFDQSHWEKILMNLLNNAIKFTTAGGEIQVSLSLTRLDQGDAAIIQVADTGIGISQEELPHIFDRFYQADSSDVRTQEGTGIGLSLVKELTDLMKGSVEVESEKGKGTKFTVMLPVEKLEEPTQTPHSDKMDEQVVKSEESPLILVVEDNKELCDFITSSLNKEWDVVSAKNGFDALKQVEEQLPDVIISDVMMPGMSGYELCEKVKTDHRFNHIRFIMLTAKTAQSSKEQGLSLGADDYLTKPFHVHELELRINNALIQQRNLREKLIKQLLPPDPSFQPLPVEDAFVQKLYNFLEDNYQRADLEVPEIALAMNMSKSTFNRKLRAILNASGLNVLRQFRLQKAAALLQAGETISNAAYATGFESPSYFTQSFKETYGTTPSAFKKAS